MSNSTKSDWRFKPKLSPEQASELVAEYLSGHTRISTLAKRFELCHLTVRDYLRRAGVKPPCQHVIHTWAPEIKTGLVSDYQSGVSQCELAKRTGVSRTAISRILIGVRKRTRNETSQKHSFNANAFRSQSNARDYFFGLLLADGCITKAWHQPTMQTAISLTASDRHLLDEFRTFLEATHPVRIFLPKKPLWKQKPRACFYVTSNELAQSLRELGINERKSLHAVMPIAFANNPNAWRGYVDGDGWVKLRIQGRSVLPIVGVCGSQAICTQFNEYAYSLGASQVAVRPCRSIWSTQHTGKNATLILQELYGQDQRPALYRKQLVASVVLSSYYGDQLRQRQVR